ncbi:MAG: ferredoxin-type protein NapF [Rhodospirillales bacterium]|nr:ferredoxin-type protein NapF [Rhodospirillales bacterium]
MLATQKVSRFQLLRRGFRGDIGGVLRPPFAVDAETFTDICDRSGKCIKACPKGIIGRGSGGFPEIDFSKGECTFCYDCIDACKSGALKKATYKKEITDQPPWTYKAVIGDGCLSASGVTCRVCGDICDSRAIKFRLAIGGKAFPELTLTDCNGCGACVVPCPTKTISIKHEEIERKEAP